MLSALALTLLSTVSAIRVVAPGYGTVWSSGQTSQTISWIAVSTDPSSFVVQLVNQAGYLSNSPVTIAQNVPTGNADVTQSTTITYPGGTWPVGDSFQINLVTSTQSNQAILAQSMMFNISNTGAAAAVSTTSTSVGTTPTLLSGMTSTTTTASAVNIVGSGSSTNGTGSGDASGGIPNASVTSKAAADLVSAPSAITSLLLAAATFLGIFA